MTNHEAEQHVIDYYHNIDDPMRKDDQEKIHNIIKDLHWKNGYDTITFCVKYLEMIKEDRVQR